MAMKFIPTYSMFEQHLKAKERLKTLLALLNLIFIIL
jgi:hypothetical protein